MLHLLLMLTEIGHDLQVLFVMCK